MNDKKYSLSDLIMRATKNGFKITFNSFDGTYQELCIRVQKDFDIIQTIIPYESELDSYIDFDRVVYHTLNQILLEFCGLYPEHVKNIIEKG